MPGKMLTYVKSNNDIDKSPMHTWNCCTQKYWISDHQSKASVFIKYSQFSLQKENRYEACSITLSYIKKALFSTYFPFKLKLM